jgi:hypothetical protein
MNTTTAPPSSARRLPFKIFSNTCEEGVDLATFICTDSVHECSRLCVDANCFLLQVCPERRQVVQFADFEARCGTWNSTSSRCAVADSFAFLNGATVRNQLVSCVRKGRALGVAKSYILGNCYYSLSSKASFSTMQILSSSSAPDFAAFDDCIKSLSVSPSLCDVRDEERLNTTTACFSDRPQACTDSRQFADAVRQCERSAVATNGSVPACLAKRQALTCFPVGSICGTGASAELRGREFLLARAPPRVVVVIAGTLSGAPVAYYWPMLVYTIVVVCCIGLGVWRGTDTTPMSSTRRTRELGSF